jgi:hypothetical protein
MREALRTLDHMVPTPAKLQRGGSPAYGFYCTKLLAAYLLK